MTVLQLLLELAGFAALILAAFLVSPALGFAVLGLVLVLIGNAHLPQASKDEEKADEERAEVA